MIVACTPCSKQQKKHGRLGSPAGRLAERATTVGNDAGQLPSERLDAVLQNGLEKPTGRPGLGKRGAEGMSGDECDSVQEPGSSAKRNRAISFRDTGAKRVRQLLTTRTLHYLEHQQPQATLHSE